MDRGGQVNEDFPTRPKEGVDEARAYPTTDAAVQLRKALEAKDAIKQRFLETDSLSQLPGLALKYVEAANRSKLAAVVVAQEAGLLEQPIEVRGHSEIITRGR